MPPAVPPYLYIDPPEVTPYEQGLFGAVQELTTDDPHWLIGGVEWESLASYSGQLYAAGAGTQAGAGGTKTLDAGQLRTKAWPFAVYAGLQCGTFGHTPAEFEARLLRLTELSEQHAAERALWTGGASNSPALNATGTTDVTGGVATELGRALGLLENWLADNYNAKGQIHARRSVGILASQKHLAKYDPETPNRYMTPLGTRWVWGGGYDGTGPAAATPATGTTWIYATGQTIMARGQMELPADFKAAIHRIDNQQYMVAERPYIIGVDGTWAAALVDLTK